MDYQTSFVTYNYTKNGKELMYPFEVNLQAELVRGVLGDPVLEKKYGFLQSK